MNTRERIEREVGDCLNYYVANNERLTHSVRASMVTALILRERAAAFEEAAEVCGEISKRFSKIASCGIAEESAWTVARTIEEKFRALAAKERASGAQGGAA